MRTHTLNVLGLEVSFKAEADPRRVERARLLLEERSAKLQQHGAQLSKEKLLTFMALALADDYLIAQAELESARKQMEQLLITIENHVGKPT